MYTSIKGSKTLLVIRWFKTKFSSRLSVPVTNVSKNCKHKSLITTQSGSKRNKVLNFSSNYDNFNTQQHGYNISNNYIWAYIPRNIKLHFSIKLSKTMSVSFGITISDKKFQVGSILYFLYKQLIKHFIVCKTKQ